MPQIVLANSIGQPTNEVQAQTQKPIILPVRVSAEGGVTHPKESPVPQPIIQGSNPAEAESAPEPVRAKAPAKSAEKLQEEERFAALIRREKAMRNKVREYETSQAKIKADYEAKEAEYKAQVESANQAKQWQEGLKTDLIGTLTSAGYTTDQITQALINQPGPESQLIKSLSEKIAKMEQAQQDHFKSQQEEASKNYQSALNTIERNVNSLISKNPEFELTKASGSSKKVVSYIEKVWKDEGVMLDVEDATKDVEDYLTDEAIKLARLGKIQKKLAPKAKPAPVAAAPAKSPTLTNKMATHGKPLSAKERAILAFNQGRVRK